MPIIRLRHLDITTKEEEELVQEVLSSRLSQMPQVSVEVNIRVPDIKTVEEEKFWQAKIDEARAKDREQVALQGAIEGAEVVIPSDVPVETVPETVPAEVTPAVEEPPTETTPVGKKKGRPKKTK